MPKSHDLFGFIQEEGMTEILYKPIGIIISPHQEPKGTPIQSAAARGISGVVEIYPEFSEGLKDVAGFSYIFLIYHLHLIKESSLLVKPFLDDQRHGVFATRAPGRPNPIGISIVKLVKVEGNKVYIEDVDIVDRTPLLDIKPYVPEFDVREAKNIGWYEKNIAKLPESKDDGRFIK
jgi:tRNA-Thr(GGU) m(6)t(6)A37 methyltransferase TsaA